jgi:hypothetical protein
MKTLILALSFLSVCVFAQPAAPAWLSQLKLSGLSGVPDHPLAVINDKTLSPGEECDLKLKGRIIHLQCLEIHEQSVSVQIQGLRGPCEMTFSGNHLPVENNPVAALPAQPVAKVEPPAPVPVTPVNFVMPAQPTRQPPASGKSWSPGIILFFAGMIFALIVGISMGSGAAQWQHRQNIGEALLADTIGRHFSRPHLLLNNVTLPTADGTTQIDHILVAETGIFVIEAKHYTGWIFGNPLERQWTQTIYHHKSRFQNPIHQNYGHVKELQSLFNLPEDHFHSVVVFTGEAEFKSDQGPNVIRLAELIPFLNADRRVIFDERKMAYTVGRIEMKRKRRSLETDEYHLNHVRDRMAGKLKS